MSIEITDEIARIKSVFPIKQGKLDDSPLGVIIKLSVDMRACDILPYFHPVLRSSFFSDNGLTFCGLIESLKLNQEFCNLEVSLGIIDYPLQVTKASGFIIYPFTKEDENEKDDRDYVTLSFKIIIDLGDSVTSPINLLSELINSDTAFSLRSSQLNLLENQKD